MASATVNPLCDLCAVRILASPRVGAAACGWEADALRCAQHGGLEATAARLAAPPHFLACCSRTHGGSGRLASTWVCVAVPGRPGRCCFGLTAPSRLWAAPHAPRRPRRALWPPCTATTRKRCAPSRLFPCSACPAPPQRGRPCQRRPLPAAFLLTPPSRPRSSATPATARAMAWAACTPATRWSRLRCRRRARRTCLEAAQATGWGLTDGYAPRRWGVHSADAKVN